MAELLSLAQTLKLAKVRHFGNKSLIFCFARNNLESLVAYLTALEFGHTVCLLNGELTAEQKLSLTQKFNPELILDSSGSLNSTAEDKAPLWSNRYRQVEGTRYWWRRGTADEPGSYMPPLHPDLALLIPNSNDCTTLVRLSFSAVLCDARSISYALGISQKERAITSLPIFTATGLSVVNSHLQTGGSIVVAAPDVQSGTFWKLARDKQCTTFAGTPQIYQLLRDKKLEELGGPQLLNFSNSDGNLDLELISRFALDLDRRRGRLFLTYGKAESTARMSVVPPERLVDKPDSSGLPIPWGEFLIHKGGSAFTKEENSVGEIIYRGPNVMLGYAQSREDLALGDEQHGFLFTGDFGRIDQDGFIYVSGKMGAEPKIVLAPEE